MLQNGNVVFKEYVELLFLSLSFSLSVLFFVLFVCLKFFISNVLCCILSNKNFTEKDKKGVKSIWHLQYILICFI
jgi:hypothetical protein